MIATKDARNMLGENPVTFANKTTKIEPKTSPENLEIFANNLLANLMRMVRLYPLATTMCVKETVIKAAETADGRAVFCPASIPIPRSDAGEGIVLRRFSPKKSLASLAGSAPVFSVIPSSDPYRMLATKDPKPADIFPEISTSSLREIF